MSQENNQTQAEEEQKTQQQEPSNSTSTQAGQGQANTAADNSAQNSAKAEAQATEQKPQSGQENSGHDGDDELSALSVEELIKKVKEAQEKADENWDIALRSKAEADNVRRRSEKDVANARKFGIEKLANELLPVKDSMEMGIKAVQEIESKDDATAKILEGMEMTLKMMATAMDKIGIKEIDPQAGDPFNPEFHQAMSMQEVEGAKSNTIVSAFQKGYTLNDRLMRPAMVMVAK